MWIQSCYVYDKNKLAAYMTKQFATQDKTSLLFNRRCYFVLQGLDKPYVIKSWDVGDSAYNSIKSAVVSSLLKRNSVTNGFAGNVNYNSYIANENVVSSMFPDCVLAEKRM
jgi:hypothetical protein